MRSRNHCGAAGVKHDPARPSIGLNEREAGRMINPVKTFQMPSMRDRSGASDPPSCAIVGTDRWRAHPRCSPARRIDGCLRPRSSSDGYVRSNPARSASNSCVIPARIRVSFKMWPNTTANFRSFIYVMTRELTISVTVVEKCSTWRALSRRIKFGH